MVNIALVDDEQSILTSVSLSLESEGFTVDTFLNGLDALDAFNNKSYDLGLFDIKMPKMDGNELLTKVRASKIEKLKEMPIIFLTSKDPEQDEIIGLRMGAADYIKKTIFPKTF
jgi:Response regulators consisting of a CheY-like receiver domain and a winged-helix DNA-binding domain